VNHRIKRNSRNLTAEGLKAAQTGNTGTVEDYRREFENDYARELHAAIEGNAKTAKQFFIYVVRKPMYGVETDNVYRQVFMGLHMRPRAEPNTDCWYIDIEKYEAELLWVLPTRLAIQQLAITPPPGADPFLVSSVKEYVNGSLNTEYDRIAALGANPEVSGVQLEGDEGGTTPPQRRKRSAKTKA
jgi:hypothetical protein